MLSPKLFPASRSQGWQRYVAAILLVLSAVAVRRLMLPFLDERKEPDLFFFPCVMVAAWFGGFGPGLLTTLASGALIVRYARGAHDVALVVVFVVSGLLISALHEVLRAEMRRSQRLRAARETLLGIVAHDRANPLSCIMLASRALRRRAELALEPSLDVIDPSVGRMDRLIRDLRDATRLENEGGLDVVLGDVDAADIVVDAMVAATPLANAKGVVLEHDVFSELSWVRGARGIVTAHDGRIWAHSEPGKGTTLFVEIPTDAHDDRASRKSALPGPSEPFRLS